MTGPLRPTRSGWGSRLQRVPIRVKVVVPMVGLAVVPAVGLGAFTISRMRDALRREVLERTEFDTVLRARAAQTFLQGLHRDLRFLSQIGELQDLAAAEASGDLTATFAARREAERELSIFTQGRSGYAGLRYLNGGAEEVLGLVAVDSVPRLVPQARLQVGPDPLYQDAVSLAPGEIYIASVRMEAGEAADERAMPDLLCATPVIWDDGGPGRGLLVVSVDAAYFFSLLGEISPGVEAWLVDQDGMYLGYAGRSSEKMARYHMTARRSVGADFTPSEVALILDPSLAPRSFQTSASLLSLAPIAFDAQLEERRWKLLIAHPLTPVYAPVRRVTVLMWSALALTVVAAAVTGLLVGRYVARPVEALRRATREIAAGDLSRRVDVLTGDEIQGLATDFNTMAGRLEEALARLSSWNRELESEVTRQTGQLQALQAGLARTDKLASIGQMTASILHEVGNPLAAIKTRIQVAEQAEAMRGRERELLPDVKKEVDRLAGVLRSFSRFGRLRATELEAVSVEGVARDVASLIAPELRRRSLRLTVESAEGVGAIRGEGDRLRQLLINLILNAADAGGEGDEVRVTVGPAPVAVEATEVRALRIQVIDRGSGIPPEDLERVWSPFFTTKPEGTGLGLAICRKIVEEHGGSIALDSTVGSGTVVTLTFPPIEAS